MSNYATDINKITYMTVIPNITKDGYLIKTYYNQTVVYSNQLIKQSYVQYIKS